MAVKISRDTARIISNVLHPYVVLSLVVAIIAYQQSPGLVIWAKWTMVALLWAYLLPLIYMWGRATVLVRTTGTQVGLRSFFREQSGEMAILVCIFGIPLCN